MKYKKDLRRDQKFWHQKMINMLDPEITIGPTWTPRFFNENYYSVRTLKAFCFAFQWYKDNKNILPDGNIRFHGKYFSICKNEKLIACVCFEGCKVGMIEVFDKEACTALISKCRPHRTEKLDGCYQWDGG